MVDGREAKERDASRKQRIRLAGDVSRLTRKLLGHDARLQRWAGRINIVAAFAAAIGSALISYSSAYATFGIFLAVTGGLIIVVISFWLSSFTQLAPDILEAATSAVDLLESLNQENEKILANHDQASENARRLAVLFSVTRAYLDLIETSTRSKPRPIDRRDPIIGEMLDLLVTGRSELFGMGDESYQFSVYITNGTKDRLVNVGCRRPTRAQEEAASPDVAASFGIMGIAFTRGKEYVCDDTADDQVFVDRDGMDRTRYRSIAAVPITDGAGSLPPLGVVVATSDAPRRFRKDDLNSVEPLRATSAALALYIGFHHNGNLQ